VARLLLRALCVLLFVAWTEESQSVLYEGHWKSAFDLITPFVSSLPLVSLSPWQLLLLALAPACLLSRGARRRRSSVLDAAVLVAVLSTALTFAWGLAREGSAFEAYFQLRGFLTALLVAALLSAVTRDVRDIATIAFTVLAAGLTRATLALYFYVVHVRSGRIVPPPSYMTTHEDSLLWVAGILILLAWALARGRPWVWSSALALSGFLLWAMVVNARRLAWLELALALAFGFLMLPKGAHRRRISAAAAVAAPVLVAYAAIGWGRPEPIFEPLRAFSTSGSDTDNSSLARLEEIRNLIYTLSRSGNPIVGVGWGQPYEKATSVYANFEGSWSQYLYMPHNSLLGVAVFGGLAGLAGMWSVVPVASFLGMRGVRGARGPGERAAAMAAVAILPGFGVQCYGDLGMKQLASTLVFGVAFAVAATTARWSDAGRAAQGPRSNAARPAATAS